MLVKIQIYIFGLCIFFMFHSCCPKVIYADRQEPVFRGNFSENSILSLDTIKVVSFNIEYGEKIDQAITELNTVPELKDPHILLLQEMDELGVKKIARELKMEYIYYPAAVHTYGRNFGEAVLTKGKMTDHFKVILPHRNPICHQKRIAAIAIIRFNNISILAGSTHLEVNTLGVAKRIAQARGILKSIPDSIRHVIIGGDFNTLVKTTIDSLDNVYRGKGYSRATQTVDYTVASAPFGWIKLNLDHLFIKGFTSIKSGSYKQTQASDHYPVWSVLKIINDI